MVIMKNKKILYLFFIFICVIFILHAIYLNCIAEDSFITFRFAKNLANGDGLVWNIGEPPVEGYTNFLWVIISALALKLNLNILLFSQILGMLASLVAIIYTYKFSKKLLGIKGYYSIIPCLFLAFSGPFATWAASGMETNFFAAFILMGVYYFISYWKFDSQKELLLGFVSLLFATLTRPEGFLIFIILLGISPLLIWLFKKPIKIFILVLTVYIIPFLVYFFWRLNYFGFLLPNTFYAKTGGTIYQYIRGLSYTGFFIAYFILPLVPLLILLLWEKRKHPVTKRLLDSIKLNVAAYVCILICTIYTAFIIWVGGDYMAMYRFFVPLLPFFYVFAGLIISKLSFSKLSEKVLAIVLILFALAATLIQSTPLENNIFVNPPNLHGSYSRVLLERWHSNRLSLIGTFFNEYKTSSNESLATNAIGAVSYYADMKIYGFHGLVDPEIAHIRNKSLGRGLPGHEKKDLLYTLSKNPTYFMFNRDLYKKPLSYPDYGPEVNQVIQENYKLAYVWLVDTENGEEGYFSFLELKEK